jgi:protein N-terminal methyltransferase
MTDDDPTNDRRKQESRALVNEDGSNVSSSDDVNHGTVTAQQHEPLLFDHHEEASTTTITTSASSPLLTKPQTPVIQEPSSCCYWHGSDTDGRTYSSIDDMWKEQDRSEWYQRAADYYEEHCPPTLDGVLGGFASISDVDLQGSKQFIQTLIEEQLLHVVQQQEAPIVVCECGAGIGRVSKHLLLPMEGVKRCDLVESSARLLSAAPDYLGEEAAAKCRFYCIGLQEWEPPPNTYSIIWIQWVLCYLTDADVVSFLRKCAESLIHDNNDEGGGGGGLIVLKENTCMTEAFVVDNDDASVTRSLPFLRSLIQEAGLNILLERMQDDFPADLFPVPMLAIGRNKKALPR